MPQFDKLSYLNQTIWFFLLFSLFYLILLKMFFPVFSGSIKTRNRFIKNLFTSSNKTVYFESKTQKIKNVQQKYKSLFFPYIEKKKESLNTCKIYNIDA